MVRLCPDVVSMSRVLQVTVIFVVSLWPMSLGILVASTLAPCEHHKGDLGVQA